MSDRDEGDQRAFRSKSDGKYDLSKWNDTYWNQFDNLLRLCEERDIVVQIEVWDQYDHSGNAWRADPFNPKNNINYTFAETGLDSVFIMDASMQPFFFTVPALKNNGVLLKYQQAFVIKMLSISLQYNNVLYCIDNETRGTEEWSAYWADFIHKNSGGKNIYITTMWDAWDVKSDMHKRTIDYPERYSYIDISQNSQIPGRQNWDNAQYVFSSIKDRPRPANSTKIYGSDHGLQSWLSRGINTEHAVQTFFRNVLGGFASSRFQRPSPNGLGFSQTSINCIKTIRKIETMVKMWDIIPRMDLLKIKDENQAYLAAKEGEYYLVYFTRPGNVKLDLGKNDNTFVVKWINIENAEWGKTDEIKGGQMVDLEAINVNGSFAVLKRK